MTPEFKFRNDSEVFKPWRYMISCVRQLHVKFNVAASSAAEVIGAESGQVWIFWIFHWRDNFCDKNEWNHNFLPFSSARKFSFVARRNQAKFGALLNRNSRVTVLFNKISTILLYTGRLAVYSFKTKVPIIWKPVHWFPLQISFLF